MYGSVDLAGEPDGSPCLARPGMKSPGAVAGGRAERSRGLRVGIRGVRLRTRIRGTLAAGTVAFRRMVVAGGRGRSAASAIRVLLGDRSLMSIVVSVRGVRLLPRDARHRDLGCARRPWATVIN